MRINCEISIIQEKQYKKLNHAVFERKQHRKKFMPFLEENSIKGIITLFRKETA